MTEDDPGTLWYLVAYGLFVVLVLTVLAAGILFIYWVADVVEHWWDRRRGKR